MAAMTSSINFSPYLNQTDLNFQGIFVHPSHLSPTGSFSSDSDSMSYMDEDLVSTSGDFPNILSSRSSTEDYFSSSFNSTPSTSSLYNKSPSSSTSSTPTGESYSLTESTNMNRRIAFPLAFSFANRSSFSLKSGPISPCTQDIPLPSYQFPIASVPSTSSCPLVRSVSSPVETQRQLDQRNQMLSAVAEKMVATVEQVRAKSSAGLESMSGRDTRFGAGTLFPSGSGFEENWGASLPQREAVPATSNTFPYNLVHSVSTSKPLQTRLSRSLSALTIPNPYPTPSTNRHNSLPTTVQSSPSRPRRATFMTPLTPISTSETLLSVNELTL